jgi:serine protease Do
MKTKNILLAGGAAVLSVGLIALPSISHPVQDAAPAAAQKATPPAAPAAPTKSARVKIMRSPQATIIANGVGADDETQFAISLEDEGGSWLGVETQEVTSDKAKDLKLSAERGVVIGKVLDDSPAAKAGLKEGDVITDINGQHVEGTVQFRRIIRETPPGRTLQLTIWRNGRSENVSATLGKMQENRKHWMNATPQAFSFRMPEIPEVAPMPEIPSVEWDNGNLLMNRPRLGIDAEDISGQLGSYFGAPDGEGILVREVNPGSAAENAGVKAGDVITSLNGERIRGLSELRSKMSSTTEGKPAKLGILRNKSALTLDVEIPAVKHRSAHRLEMRTRI